MLRRTDPFREFDRLTASGLLNREALEGSIRAFALPAHPAATLILEDKRGQ
jgi:hypothetical protein